MEKKAVKTVKKSAEDVDAIALRKLALKNENIAKTIRSAGFTRSLEIFKAGVKRGKSASRG